MSLTLGFSKKIYKITLSPKPRHFSVKISSVPEIRRYIIVLEQRMYRKSAILKIYDLFVNRDKKIVLIFVN